MGITKNKEFQRYLRDLAQKLEIEDQIEWGGFTKVVRQEYLQASVVLNFSVSESFSLTVQEAMYYGCPVIATASGGPSEIIDHEKTGLLVDVNDIAAMTSAMALMIIDKIFRERVGRAAFASAREKFKYENTSGKVAEVYFHALKRNS